MEVRHRSFTLHRPIGHRNMIAYGFAFMFGLVAIYGLGHIYIGRIRRGLVFLVPAVFPFGLLLQSILLPNVYPFYRATIVWALIFVVQLWDLNRIIKTDMMMET